MLTLKTNLGDSPVTLAIKDGRVRSDRVRLDCCGPTPAHDGFKAMLRENAYDAGELAINTYLQARAYGKPYVMLPAPVVARLQHHCIAFNRAFGPLAPKDLEGRRVGVRTYAQTTGLWVRGLLQHDHGVDLERVTWCTVDDAHLAEYQDPPHCERLPPGSSLGAMLLAGELAAVIASNDMPQDPRVQRLIPDAAEAARQWQARHGLVPINHVFVVHRDVARAHPEAIRELWRMLQEARALAPDAALATFPPMGWDANRRGLELAIELSYEQKIIPRRLSVDELVDEATAAFR